MGSLLFAQARGSADRHRLYLHLSAAKAFGLTIPSQLFGLADRLIE
jgi:hypothetical protein